MASAEISGLGMVVDIVYGFLGSGKTTFITRILNEWGDKERIVVLVNEFGEVGIDGTVLKDLGGNVVEMPSGCICCTLQSDFRSQLLDIMQTIKPQRVIIEPTGVATITQIRSIIEAQLFENAIRQIHYVLIADASGFMGLYRANPHFVESQVKNARVVLLNKCDKVDKRGATLIRNAISAINPDATVLMTEFGAVEWSQYQMALSAPPEMATLQEGLQEFGIGPRQGGEMGGDHSVLHLEEEEDVLGLESFGLVFDDLSFDETKLMEFFKALLAVEMGEVIRAKGIFRVGKKSILMEYASGEFSSQPIRDIQQSRISIIGKNLNRKEMELAIERCLSSES